MRSEVLAVQVEAAARAAGLAVVSSEADASSGTAKFLLAPAGDAAAAAGKTMLLELSERFEFGRPDLKDGVRAYLAEVGQAAEESAAGVRADAAWDSAELWAV